MRMPSAVHHTGLMLALAFVVWTLAGCGSDSVSRQYQANEDEPPPATAGSLEALVGTSWELGQGQTLTFMPDGAGSGSRAGSPPMDFRYTLEDNGVINIVMMGASRSGTWDGTDLVIGGEKATRISGT